MDLKEVFVLSTKPRQNSFRMREIGVTCSGQKGADDSKTLAQARFSIGDFLDISITPPNRLPPQRRGPRPY
uniref:18 kDa Sin3-associated polypeptide n=1 Tax=Megaselia scalaris TaxID=36166 RepID=T1GDY5_MEGSC